MTKLSDELVKYFRAEYFADKLGPSYREEYRITSQVAYKDIAIEKLAFSAGFRYGKRYIDMLIESIETDDLKLTNEIIKELKRIDEFAIKTYD